MEKENKFLQYLVIVIVTAILVYILNSCKTTNCDAYSIRDYEYIQVVGYTDTIPTLGEEYLHMPPGKYLVKGWKQGQEVSHTVIVRESQK